MLNMARKIVLVIYAAVVMVLGLFFVPKWQFLRGRVYTTLWDSGTIYTRDLVIELVCVTLITAVIFWIVGEKK